MIASLLEEVMDLANPKLLPTIRPTSDSEAQACHGCGQIKEDVDPWARTSETGEEVWLCLSCADW